jgi:coenzyme F420 biosynthesis associated uncharacterized protein
LPKPSKKNSIGVKGPPEDVSVEVQPVDQVNGGEADGSGGLVDWSVAERVAGWSIARHRPPASYRFDVLAAEFDELTIEAEALVIEATGLRPPTPARARVVDRSGWVGVNVASIQRLLGPTLAKVEARREEAPLSRRALGPFAGVSRTLSGAQLGLVLAWMSSRVLGQYDLLLATEAVEDQDIVYYVGPNVVAIEERYGFPPRQFRLWLALHEVTHRSQFTGVPWLRDHFVSLVDEGLEPLGSDPHRVVEALRRAGEELKAGRSPLADAGMIGLVATDDQLEALQRIQALMSLVEGHGDVIMDRAGAAAVPGAERFSRVLHQRRTQVKGPAKLLQQILGLEAKLRQYQEGEEFVHQVERAGGPELFNRVWRGPEWLPSLKEIRDPSSWVDRVQPRPAVLG